MDSRLRRNELGFWEVNEKPSPEELQEYYSNQYFQQTKGSYEESYSPDELNYLRNRWKLKKKIVEKIRGNTTGSLLDIGCGEGNNIAFFREIGWSVRGLDFSTFGVETHHPECIDFVITGDIYELLEEEKRQENSYDIIWMQNVLEHVIDPINVFRILSSLVTAESVVVITVPNDFSISQLSAKEHGHIDSDFWIVLPDHLNYFSPESLVNVSEKMGWSVKELISDFPVDWFLFHEGSNYIRNKSLGKAAHFARIQIENSLQQNNSNDIIEFWSSLPRVGVGRNLTIFLQKEPESDSHRKYACMLRERITKGHYSIETIQDSDIESIRGWRNSQLEILRQSKAISMEEQKHYFQNVIWPSMREPNPSNILLRFLLDGKLIGYGGLVHIEWEHKRAEVSFLLNTSLAADKVTYAECYSNFLSLLKELAFMDLGFKRLFTETFAIRKHHISILESNGFRVEGVMKNHVYIDGKPIDSIIHGFLASYVK